MEAAKRTEVNGASGQAVPPSILHDKQNSFVLHCQGHDLLAIYMDNHEWTRDWIQKSQNCNLTMLKTIL